MITNLHRDGLCYNTMMCYVNTSQIKMWVRCHSGNGTKDREEKGGVVIKGLPDFHFDFLY